jgi:hypothetical protein
VKLSVEEIAELAHEANKAYCESVGDKSQLGWAEAQDWQRKSAVVGVQFLMQNPEAKPEDTHQSWVDQKVADGWVYGDEKSVEKKTHPCLLPYSELPEFQRSKDYIFKAVVCTALKFKE